MTELEWQKYISKIAKSIKMPGDQEYTSPGTFKWKTLGVDSKEKNRRRNKSHKAECKRVDKFFETYKEPGRRK